MIKRFKQFIKNCIEARDYLMGVYMFRCIYDVVRLGWLFLCLLVTGYAFIIGIIDAMNGKGNGSTALAIMVMFTCSGYLLRNILVSSKNSTL